jgi:hypothetical protein
MPLAAYAPKNDPSVRSQKLSVTTSRMPDRPVIRAIEANQCRRDIAGPATTTSDDRATPPTRLNPSRKPIRGALSPMASR